MQFHYKKTSSATPVLTAAVAAIILSFSISSCANDSGSGGSSNTVAADTSSTMSTDTATAAAPAHKMRKGKASVAVAAGSATKIEKDKDGVYNMAEKMPAYPGGEAALSQFAASNINYPQDAIDQGTEGTVNVSFVINEKGKVMNAVVTGRTAGHGLDEEALRMIQQMPQWKPGLVKGHPVKTRLTLPVTFKLADA